MQWRTEVAAGSQFVYVKATEGTTYVNPNFVADYTAARAAHRYVGAYVYARPDLADPIGQAEHFLRHARFTRDAQTLVPFVDLEWPYGGVRTDDCHNLNPGQLRAWIRAFVDRIEAGIGRKADDLHEYLLVESVYATTAPSATTRWTSRTTPRRIQYCRPAGPRSRCGSTCRATRRNATAMTVMSSTADRPP